MGDDWNEDDTEVAAPVSAGLVEVAAADLPEIQLFGKWSCEEVNVSDMSAQAQRSNLCVPKTSVSVLDTGKRVTNVEDD